MDINKMTSREIIEKIERDTKRATHILYFLAVLGVGWCVFTMAYTLVALLELRGIIPPITIELIKTFF